MIESPKGTQTLLAIDPGNTHSGFVIINENGAILSAAKFPNAEVLRVVQETETDHLAIEMIASYGMAVGKEVFDTCVWIGRFSQASKLEPSLVYRKDVKMWLCQSMRAKDKNIRRAILDKYPSTGGGKTPQVGTKNKQGPLYGIANDIWAALAVGLTYYRI